MKQSRKEFIKQGHKAACSKCKEKIEKEFPEIFKEDALVVGKWYKDVIMFCFNGKYGNYTQYGFGESGSWYDNLGVHKYNTYTPATDKEVEEALIKEAKKRGFKEGAVVNQKPAYNGYGGIHTVRSNDFKYYSLEDNFSINGIGIYKKGKWAEIVKETITKEQAEKELGKTILN
jgi:hypothetical protein